MIRRKYDLFLSCTDRIRNIITSKTGQYYLASGSETKIGDHVFVSGYIMSTGETVVVLTLNISSMLYYSIWEVWVQNPPPLPEPSLI